MPLMRSSTAWRAPLPTASIAMTEATPMTMPSSVSAVRKRFERRARPAAFAASSQPRTVAADRLGAPTPGDPCRRLRPRIAHDLAVADLDHAVGMRRHLRRVGDHDDGVALPREVLEQRQDLGAARAVECAGGLVGEDDLAAVHERARDGDALLLAARQLGSAWCSSRSASPSIVSSERARSRRGPGGVPA